MKTLHALLLALVAGLAFAANVHSQAPAAPKTPAQQLQALKTKNAEIMQKQNQTLLLLEEMTRQAEQLKALGKRT